MLYKVFAFNVERWTKSSAFMGAIFTCALTSSRSVCTVLKLVRSSMMEKHDLIDSEKNPQDSLLPSRELCCYRRSRLMISQTKFGEDQKIELNIILDGAKNRKKKRKQRDDIRCPHHADLWNFSQNTPRFQRALARFESLKEGHEQ